MNLSNLYSSQTTAPWLLLQQKWKTDATRAECQASQLPNRIHLMYDIKTKKNIIRVISS